MREMNEVITVEKKKAEVYQGRKLRLENISSKYQTIHVNRSNEG
jgi:hypothetical protein